MKTAILTCANNRGLKLWRACAAFPYLAAVVALALSAWTCQGANPFITSIYTADPAAHVWSDGRLYVYASHDIDPPTGCNFMDRYHVFSTADMVNWQDEGEIVRASEMSWSPLTNEFMWAPDCAYANDQYYFYFPHPDTTNWNDSWEIGVASSLSPVSGFTPHGYIQGVGGFGMIDPDVFIDTNGQAYLFYGGGGNCAMAKLNPDMISINGAAQPITNLNDFHEATWVFARSNLYYLTYADNYSPNNRLEYATSSSPLGPWTNQGVYLQPTDGNTSQGSAVEYKGQWYQFYHNQSLTGNGCLRSICVDLLNFDTNGLILTVNQTTSGPPAAGPAPAPATNTITYSVTNGAVSVASFVAVNGAYDGWCVENLHLANSYFQLSTVDGGSNGGRFSMNLHFATDQNSIGNNSKLLVTVNGMSYSYINTLYTGGWSTFTGNSYLTIPLGPGPTNVIQFAGGNNGVNPDYVAFTPLPPSIWNAQVRLDANFGARSNQFGFDVAGVDWAYVVDALTNLANPVWTPVATNNTGNSMWSNIITGGVSYFGDPRWTNFPARLYRVREP